jgi:hypothetical protein
MANVDSFSCSFQGTGKYLITGNNSSITDPVYSTIKNHSPSSGAEFSAVVHRTPVVVTNAAPYWQAFNVA